MAKNKATSDNPLAQFFKDKPIGGGLIGIILLSTVLVPLPGLIIDTAITFSLCAAFTLFLITLENNQPLKLNFFPTAILMLTVFRLLLSVATTKNILGNNQVGTVIPSIGEVIMGGQLVPGLVVFSIITIVQFVVITKGAERVAEVGARFTLDALPGKQMSIDGDLKSGIITAEMAKEARETLGAESKLLGSLDGSMKFVKGDAIAGIIISLVNLLGGLYVGTSVFGMGMAESVETFTILTIGDGLVSQIPSLLTSVAAGVYLTRMSKESDDKDKDQSFIGSVSAQLKPYNNTLIIAGIAIGGLALIPGFPRLFFAVSGLALIGLGVFFRLSSKITPTQEEIDYKVFLQGSGILTNVVFKLQSATPPRIDFAIKEKLKKEYWDLDFGEPKVIWKKDMEASLSVVLDTLPIYNKALNDIKIEFLEDVGIVMPQGESTDDTLNNFLTKFIMLACRDMISDRFNIQHSANILSILDAKYPSLKTEVDSALGIQRVHDVVKNMLTPNGFVIPIEIFFEKLLFWSKRERNQDLWADMVRIACKRHVTASILTTNGNIPAIFIAEGFIKDIVACFETSDFDKLKQKAQVIREKILSVSQELKVIPVIIVPRDYRSQLDMFFKTETRNVFITCMEEIQTQSYIKDMGALS